MESNGEREMAALVTKEVALNSFEEATAIMEVLIRNEYICILSREDRHYIVQFTWAPSADRNYLEVFNYV